MMEFMVELYTPRGSRQDVRLLVERARGSAEELARDGAKVHFVHSVFVPEDETCFFLYEAESLDAVRAAALMADLPFDRVMEAVTGSALASPQE